MLPLPLFFTWLNGDNATVGVRSLQERSGLHVEWGIRFRSLNGLSEAVSRRAARLSQVKQLSGPESEAAKGTYLLVSLESKLLEAPRPMLQVQMFYVSSAKV